MDTLHPLLGTDKANPLIELLVDPAVPDTLFVHFGMRLLETVHRGADSVEEKLLAGRLYNAGFKRRELVRIFQRDRKTIQSYAEALKSGDAERLRRALSGQGAESKVGPVHERFVRMTFREERERLGCHVNSFIRDELEKKLNLIVSYETVRLITVDERGRMEAEEGALGETAGGSGPDICPASPEPGVHDGSGEAEIAGGDSVPESGSAAASRSLSREDESGPCPGADTDASAEVPEAAFREKICESGPSSSITGAENPKHSPCSENDRDNRQPDVIAGARGASQWFPHAGILLLRPEIERVTAGMEPVLCEAVRYWLGTVLCGAVNIEQTKKLDHDAIAVATGGACPKGLKRQREHLHALADPGMVNCVRRANMLLLQAWDQDIFYYDPHGVEYTGAENFLRGWLGCAHKIARVYYLDFLHTLAGLPLAAFPDDNYLDAKGRFLRNCEAFRILLGIPAGKPLTLVVDRAFYDLCDMQKWREALLYLICWEKGVKEPPWHPPSADAITCFHIIRYRNKAEDTITYRVEVYREAWQRDRSISRFVVRITKPGPKPGPKPVSTTVAVLCTDPDRDAESAVRAILRRWLQENDILYLVNNFGINQITTYKTQSYRQIAEEVADRTETPPALRKLCVQKAEIKRLWGKELLKQEQIRHRLQEHEDCIGARLRKIESDLLRDGESSEQTLRMRTERDRLKRSLRQKRRNAKRALRKSQDKVADLPEQLAEIDTELARTPNQASRLQRLIDEQYRRLLFDPKAFLDAVRIMARNLFGIIHSEVRPQRNNYRDDHVLVRNLLRAPAWLRQTSRNLTVSIILQGHRSAADRAVIANLLERINMQARLLGPNRKPVRFQLEQPSTSVTPFLCLPPRTQSSAKAIRR